MAKKNKSVTLTKEQIGEITKIASQAAVEQYHREAERSRQERRDKRLYNTRLLMEKYRGMVVYSKDAVFEAGQVEDDYDLQSLLELMKEGDESYTLTVHSIKERVATVAVILHHVDKMLEFYKFRCERTGKQEIMRKYDTVKALYLDDEQKTVEDLADEFFVDVSTVYKYNRAALQDLSAMFFGYVD